MEMESMKDMVIQASTTFYTTQDKDQRKTAEEWLNNFKKSIHAWYITDQLLHTEKNEQVLFFAAQTIRNKIQYNFHELPLESHESLKSSLLEHMEKLSSFNLTTVQTQIYIALADLVMLMGQWKNPINDILARFNATQSKFFSFIEFLTYLPEEINNKRLKLGLNRRDQIKKSLSDESLNVLNFLEKAFDEINTDDQNKYRLIYRCFSSWIEQQLFTTSQILNSKIYIQIFSFLCHQNTTTEFHETLGQCLVNMLLMYNGSSQIYHPDRPLALSLKENIIKLADAYKMAEKSGNTEKCIDFCLIFTELCSAFAYHLINEPNTLYGDFHCINLLLLIASNPEYEVFQKSFIFWFNVSEDIYTNAKCDSICNVFCPYVEHLIECVCKQCRLPIDHVGIPPSKSSEFGEFRLKATDLISDVVFIVESNQCFEKLCNVLQASLSSWPELETALFAMCAFAKFISSDNKQSVGRVVEALINLNEHVHISVRYTGIRLIGELADWLNKNSQYIDGCLNFIFAGFTDPALCQIAANTMLNICTTCQSHMLNHLDTLINIVVSADSVNIPSDAFIGLMKGTIMILGNLPNENIAEPLTKLCKIQIDGLQKVLNGELKDGMKALPVYWLDRLTSIFRTIKVSDTQSNTNPCKPVLEFIWPTLSSCFTKYQKDNKIAESCCRTLRFALRCTEKQSRNILEPLVNMIVSFYQNSHHSCYLYLGSIIVDIFGAEPDFKAGLIQMMQAFTAEAFGYLMQNCKTVENMSELRKHPDTIDDFFRLSLRFIQRCPKEFIENPIFIPIINLAVNALNIDHREAHSSITKFLSEFVSVSNNAAIRGVENVSNQLLISRIVNEMSSKIIENSINAVVNMATRDTKDGLADLLIELMTVNQRQVDIILTNVLHSLVKISPTGDEIVSDKQLTDIHDLIMRSESSSDVEQALSQLEQLFQ